MKLQKSLIKDYIFSDESELKNETKENLFDISKLLYDFLMKNTDDFEEYESYMENESYNNCIREYIEVSNEDHLNEIFENLCNSYYKIG